MQKIILAVLAVVVIGGGILYFTGTDESSVNGTAKTETTETKKTETFSLADRGPLSALFGYGESIECTFESTAPDGVTVTGTMQAANDRFRVNSTMTSAEGTFVSNMINDGEKTYVWTETPGGMMAFVSTNEAVETTEDESLTTRGALDQGFNTDENVDYDCKRWSPNQQSFVPPADVEFMDPQAMFEDMFDGNLPEGLEGMEGFDPSMFSQ